MSAIERLFNDTVETNIKTNFNREMCIYALQSGVDFFEKKFYQLGRFF